jgi:hypothetical protein
MSNNAVYVNFGPTTVTVGNGLTGDGSGGNPVTVADPLSVGELDATTVKAAYESSDGTAGASAGPFTTLASIRVKNGLVTTLTGS